MKITFENKVVFVTGAASGLGRATALDFAEAGAKLFLLDVNQDGLAETKVRVEKLGVACETHIADVSRKANCEAAVAAAVARFGRLDVLANVAGIVGFFNVTDVTEAQWEKCLGVNLNGPFYLSQAAIPHLLETSGNIVNVASTAALKGQAFTVPYATSKAGLVHMTRSMAMEYMHKPIRINAVLPGAMATEMASSVQLPDGLDMSLIQRFFNIRAPSEAAEVAKLIVFVASAQASAINGSVMTADTGVSAG